MTDAAPALKTLKIDFVSDVVCPWCAVGLGGLTTALETLKGEGVAAETDAARDLRVLLRPGVAQHVEHRHPDVFHPVRQPLRVGLLSRQAAVKGIQPVMLEPSHWNVTARYRKLTSGYHNRPAVHTRP